MCPWSEHTSRIHLQEKRSINVVTILTLSEVLRWAAVLMPAAQHLGQFSLTLEMTSVVVEISVVVCQLGSRSGMLLAAFQGL